MMPMIEISAWRGKHYIGIAELLLVLGRYIKDLRWRLRVVEAGLGPQEDLLEAWDPAVDMSTYDLLHLVTPRAQLIDGEVEGFMPDESRYPVLILRAVDSTSWDVQSSIQEVLEVIKTEYPAYPPT